ncbi:Aspartyl protease [Handroanthus impetiginosus]|uniref:Aspartyl protease n=1 Tax=Handroanthus impetiginosus TaxID=429701 RepID=A0A2G9FW02_9LAMI|nr:Aspartyl protease [Handroanthus impetiginosus]
MNAILDLGAQFSWFGCDNFTSSTYTPIPCGSRKCEIARGVGCQQHLRTCGASAFNPFQGILVSKGFAEDTLYANNQPVVKDYTFSCMESRFMEGLASGTNGILGLARTEISFHKQVVGKFKLPDKFSLCFPSSGHGKLSIGDPSLSTILGVSLSATPLIVNPVSTAPSYSVGDPSDEYFIDVKSIKVAGEPRDKISTINNYTSVHNSIYKPLTRAFVKAAAAIKIKSVAAVAPFRACFTSESISRTPAGPYVPTIDLVLPGNEVYWRINGGNAMFEVDRKTVCLGIVDGGSNPRTSIVIGAHQLQEKLLEFDLVSNQLKFFSSSLLIQGKSCSRL